MHLKKEDLEQRQDEVAAELCALLERAGRGGESSRVFEVPEYARRRIDLSLSGAKVTGHFDGLVITDWKRKEHHEGGVPEERMSEADLLLGVGVFLKQQGLRVFRATPSGEVYVIGLEQYGGIAIEGLEGAQLYSLYSPRHTDESWELTSDGAPIASDQAEAKGDALTLTKSHGKALELEPLDLTEAAYVREMKEKAKGQEGGK